MATNSMIPYSNPAGNNQNTPPGLNQPAGGAVPIGVPTSTLASPVSAATANPLIPSVVPGATPGTAGATTVPDAGSTAANATNSDKQLTDILGKGVGGDVNNLLNSIGGTDSATLQEFNASLQPGFAQAGANLDASLGASGVSANSSVAALGNANLQAQEQSTIASEDAQLTQSGQNLEASILTGLEPSATAEVAQSGWNVFGDVLQGVGGLAATTIGAAGKAGGFSELF